MAQLLKLHFIYNIYVIYIKNIVTGIFSQYIHATLILDLISKFWTFATSFHCILIPF